MPGFVLYPGVAKGTTTCWRDQGEARCGTLDHTQVYLFHREMQISNDMCFRRVSDATMQRTLMRSC